MSGHIVQRQTTTATIRFLHRFKGLRRTIIGPRPLGCVAVSALVSRNKSRILLQEFKPTEADNLVGRTFP